MSKKHRTVVPMRVPAIGAQPGQQQINIDPADATPKVCEQCGHELFDLVYRYRVVSSLSPKNPTGKDIGLKLEVLICRGCGHELGKKVEIKQ